MFHRWRKLAWLETVHNLTCMKFNKPPNLKNNLPPAQNKILQENCLSKVLPFQWAALFNSSSFKYCRHTHMRKIPLLFKNTKHLFVRRDLFVARQRIDCDGKNELLRLFIHMRFKWRRGIHKCVRYTHVSSPRLPIFFSFYWINIFFSQWCAIKVGKKKINWRYIDFGWVGKSFRACVGWWWWLARDSIFCCCAVYIHRPPVYFSFIGGYTNIHDVYRYMWSIAENACQARKRENGLSIYYIFSVFAVGL